MTAARTGASRPGRRWAAAVVLGLAVVLPGTSALPQTSPITGATGAAPGAAGSAPEASPGGAAASGGGAAQSVPLAGSSGGPVEIEASQSVEWQSQLRVYVARGDARLRQGDLEVTGDVLTAYYREPTPNQTEIWRATADGRVNIRAPQGRSQADRAVYDLDRDVIVLTGSNLRLETDTYVITARDSLEYWQRDRLAVARGDAVVVRGTDRIRADLMTGRFVDGENGGMRLSVVSAVGHVLINTATDTASANEAVYDLTTNIATLTGAVRLTRGPNHLNGDRAEVNLDTGVSRLIAGPGGGRVRGLLVPDNAERNQ